MRPSIAFLLGFLVALFLCGLLSPAPAEAQRVERMYGTDSSGNIVPILVDASGNLIVVAQ